jgi:hypothetical protein
VRHGVSGDMGSRPRIFRGRVVHYDGNLGGAGAFPLSSWSLSGKRVSTVSLSVIFIVTALVLYLVPFLIGAGMQRFR